VHGCHYCFARRYHAYLDLGVGDDFTGVILVKVNAVSVLRAELARPAWRRELVAVGTATDPYQPIEGRYRLTRGILAALAESRTPASVVTKGPMVVRDIDVLRDARDRAGVTVCMSLTTLDRDLWRRLEPGTAPPHQRLRAVASLTAAGIRAGVLLAPIVPGLTTDRSNLEAVVRAAAEHGAAFLGTGVLHLEPGVREHFTEFLRADTPALLPFYQRLYRGGAYAPSRVQDALGVTVDELRRRYRLTDRPASTAAKTNEREASDLPAGGLAGSQLSLGL
jgi:DNA repair photolyase